ncbi:MAG TPA: LptA/OstA family protein [Vicinamibacterales bacterium]|nr:LptA/OstA family protein [Vicinamibacterales bacterium]
MTWQRRARIVVAIVGLGCAAAVYFLARPRQAPVVAPVPTAPDREAEYQSGAGKYFHHDKDGKRVLELSYEKAFSYRDGRGLYEKVHAKFVEGHQIFADRVETKSPPADGEMPRNLDFRGNVRVVDKGGATVTTDQASYDDGTGIVTMPGEVTFTRGRLSGKGLGANYHRDQDFLQLLDQASLKVAPDEKSTDTVEATAKTMSFTRAQKSLRMDQNVRVVRPSETLEGDAATFGLTDDEQAIRFLELRGNARVTPGSVPNPPPRMNAHDITLGFQPDGRTLEHATLTGEASVGLAVEQGTRSIAASWIDMFLASDGRTLKGLQAKDRVVVELPATKEAPARVIKSATLDAKGDDKGLRLAQFDRDVTFEEKPAAGSQNKTPKTATARTLVLHLGGQLEAIEQAEFRQNVVFVDGDVKGDGDLGTYDARGKGKLTLKQAGASARLPRVTDGSFVVDAQTIDVALDTHDLAAKGAVRTVANPSEKKAQDKKTPGLFEEGEPVSGVAAELVYTSETGRAVYTGGKEQAELWQKSGRISADWIAVDDSTRNLEAKGKVNQKFRAAARPSDGGAQKKPTDQNVTANSLLYEDAARKATYVGAVTMKNEEGVTEGEKITLFLAKEERSIERLEVEGPGDKVFAEISGGYEVRGDRLDYDAATDVYHVVGKPVVVKSPAKDRSGCVISRGPEVKLNRKLNTVEWPPGRTDAMGTDELVKCDVSIRKSAAGR